MKSLYINLLELEKKSKFRIVIGIVFTLLAIAWFIALNRKIDVSIFDWILFIGYFLLGLFHTIGGFGFSIERLWGKSYIAIDEEHIALKIDAYKKEQNVRWETVKSITYKLNKYEIVTTTNEKKIFNLSDLPFQIKQQMKETISEIAKERNIETNSI